MTRTTMTTSMPTTTIPHINKDNDNDNDHDDDGAQDVDTSPALVWYGISFYVAITSIFSSTIPL